MDKKEEQKIIDVEKQLSSLGAKAPVDFTFKVMQEIESRKVGFFRRLYMEISSKERVVFSSVAALATVILIIKASEITPYETVEKEVSQSNSNKKNETIPVSVPAPVLGKELKDSDEKKDISGVKGLRDPQLDKQKAGDSALLFDQLQNKNAPLEVSRAMGGSIAKPNDREVAQDLTTAFKEEITDLKQVQRQKLRNPDPRTSEIFKKVPERVEEQEISAAKKAKPQSVGKVSADQINVVDNSLVPENDRRDNGVGRILEDKNVSVNRDEAYISYSENPRTNVAQEPSSTFSIDVDTASYSNARRFLKEGQLPPKDSIRIEEFVNYFDYNYPVQYEKPFTLSYEIAPSPLEQDRYFLKLGIKARDAKEETKPWNLVFLIDVSGSMMDSNKLPLVKQALKLLVEKMRANDKIAIVTYAGDTGVALDSTSIKEKSKILSAIDGLAAGGSTNGSGGITDAYEMAAHNKISEGVNRVVLATDGDFNVGITSHEDLIKLIEDKRKSGITLTALGFGTGNIKDGTMEQLADKGNGNYFYIDNFQEARKVLETDLVGNMEVVAKDVKLQIEFNPEKVASYRLIGYDNRKLNREDFNNDAIDAGEIGTGHTVTAIYEVVLANSELAKKFADEYRYQNKPQTATPVPNKELSAELAFLKIRYKEPEANESKLLQFPIEAKDLKTSLEQVSGDFKFAAAVSYFAELLRGSQFVGNYTYREVLILAESARGEDKKGYRQEFIELIKNAQSLQH